MAKLIILSDIHANLSALKAVIENCSSKYKYEHIAILGDIINYGLSPNEVIDFIKNINTPVLANPFGNHEKALFDGDSTRFSTDRGRKVLDFTRKCILKEAYDYLATNLSSSGFKEVIFENKNMLFVHGSLSDPFWGKMTEEEMKNTVYAKYDYVISGHSHIPNFTEVFYEDKSMYEYRNKKRTVFINPGSVGQPRNHNPRAQYLFIDLENEIFHFNSVAYDVEYEQSLYDNVDIDIFYKTRLKNGI